MSRIPPRVLAIVERPGANWTTDELVSVCAWLGEREQSESLIFRALQSTRSEAINFSEADVENALDHFSGHERSRFQTDLTELERHDVVTTLVSQKQLTIPVDVAEYLSREVRSNRRVLEQTVVDFISYAGTSEQPLTVPLAEQFVEGLWIWPIKDTCLLWNPALNHPRGFFAYILSCFTRHLLRLPRRGSEIDPEDLKDRDLQKWLSHSPAVRDSFLEKAVKQCEKELTPRQRQVYILRLDQQFDNAEIARRLGINEGNVRTTYSRSLDAILNCLEKKGIKL
jgi:DNA-directed RNA polymerase specialized sigma subunit, sigma24 homolog